MIKIKNKEYNLKYSIRSMFIWEQITGKTFDLKQVIDFYIYYYAILMASNKDFEITFDEFIEECDADLTIVNQMQLFLSKQLELQNQLNTNSDEKKN